MLCDRGVFLFFFFFFFLFVSLEVHAHTTDTFLFAHNVRGLCCPHGFVITAIVATVVVVVVVVVEEAALSSHARITGEGSTNPFPHTLFFPTGADQLTAPVPLLSGYGLVTSCSAG